MHGRQAYDSVVVGVRAPVALWERVQAAARVGGKSRNGFAVLALTEACDASEALARQEADQRDQRERLKAALRGGAE